MTLILKYTSIYSEFIQILYKDRRSWKHVSYRHINDTYESKRWISGVEDSKIFSKCYVCSRRWGLII